MIELLSPAEMDQRALEAAHRIIALIEQEAQQYVSNKTQLKAQIQNEVYNALFRINHG